MCITCSRPLTFQSTPPVREETCDECEFSDGNVFQSTPPVREETLHYQHEDYDSLFQSTPPVREETLNTSGATLTINISIHSSRAGGDSTDRYVRESIEEFQSTPPVREETTKPR